MQDSQQIKPWNLNALLVVLQISNSIATDSRSCLCILIAVVVAVVGGRDVAVVVVMVVVGVTVGVVLVMVVVLVVVVAVVESMGKIPPPVVHNMGEVYHCRGKHWHSLCNIGRVYPCRRHHWQSLSLWW